MYLTRFAPSPTGLLHLGHAYSALLAQDRAAAAGGTCLLRLEDTDASRVRPEYEDALYEDLAWLGFHWPEPVMRQSARADAYEAAIDRLAALGLCYPCACTRADIRAALSAPQEGVAPPPVYPGTCRHRTMSDRQPGDAVRLNMARALERLPKATHFTETAPDTAGTHVLDPGTLADLTGDVILFRRDIRAAAYHLAVVVDDAAQEITEVVRGADLADATPLHVLLQTLLELPTPTYHHHRLIRDKAGKRLAKRDDARAIRKYREDGWSPADLRARLGL